MIAGNANYMGGHEASQPKHQIIQDSLDNQDAVEIDLPIQTIKSMIMPAKITKRRAMAVIPQNYKIFKAKQKAKSADSMADSMIDPTVEKMSPQDKKNHHLTRRLENAKIINWWDDELKLHAETIYGDGNCLVHAASKAIFGHEDNDLRLRKSLENFFTTTFDLRLEKFILS